MKILKRIFTSNGNLIKLKLETTGVKMHLDACSDRTIINEGTWEQNANPKLCNSNSGLDNRGKV